MDKTAAAALPHRQPLTVKHRRLTDRASGDNHNTQSCRQRGSDPHLWIYEPRMGDAEEIEIDDSGVVLRRRDSRGIETVLASKMIRDAEEPNP